MLNQFYIGELFEIYLKICTIRAQKYTYANSNDNISKGIVAYFFQTKQIIITKLIKTKIEPKIIQVVYF
jgi:hypothetical protein